MITMTKYHVNIFVSIGGVCVAEQQVIAETSRERYVVSNHRRFPSVFNSWFQVKTNKTPNHQITRRLWCENREGIFPAENQ